MKARIVMTMTIGEITFEQGLKQNVIMVYKDNKLVDQYMKSARDLEEFELACQDIYDYMTM
jgi:hypothetical protein